LDSLIQRHTALSANIVAFCRYLRTQDFNLGVAEEQDALQALACLPLANQEVMKLLLQATLVKNLQQLSQFDKLYQNYWKEVEKAVDSKITEGKAEETSPKPTRNQQPSLLALKNWLYGNKNEEITEIATYSPSEVLNKKDFTLFTSQEMQEVGKIIQLLAKNLSFHLSRRKQRSKKHQTLDLRRTLYLNKNYQGEVLKLAYQQPKLKKLKLILICDVSKSMDLYSRFLIQFMYAFQIAYQRIETFVFSTSLQHITQELKRKNINQTLQELAEKVPQWSGGTQIGQSLSTFCQEYERLLDTRTSVIIVSDGWDTGKVELLESSMTKIHKKARSVIWLNPLAGNPDYKPATQAMIAALPHIDIFAPIHNLESLRNLLSRL
jgi:hypothetical protein